MREDSSFNAADGREWQIELDYGLLRLLRKTPGVDFGVPEKFGEVWADLLLNDDRALKVLWRCVEQDADVSEDEWLSSMDGEALEAGLRALAAAVVNFTPPRRRLMIVETIKQIDAGILKAIEAATTNVRELTDERAKAAIEALGT
jgi:hypothetical protein